MAWPTLELCHGNTESLRQALSSDSIIRRFRSFGSKRERARAWEAAEDGPRVLRVSRPRGLDAVVAALGTLPEYGNDIGAVIHA